MAYDNQTGSDAAPAGILAVAALVRDIEDLAARFAEGCVRELRSFPPEILLLGASVSQEVK